LVGLLRAAVEHLAGELGVPEARLELAELRLEFRAESLDVPVVAGSLAPGSGARRSGLRELLRAGVELLGLALGLLHEGLRIGQPLASLPPRLAFGSDAIHRVLDADLGGGEILLRGFRPRGGDPRLLTDLGQ